MRDGRSTIKAAVLHVDQINGRSAASLRAKWIADKRQTDGSSKFQQFFAKHGRCVPIYGQFVVIIDERLDSAS